MLTLEDEEEVGHSQDHMVKKGVHMYHPSTISCPLPFGEVHNSPRVAHIFGDMSCVLLQDHELLRLGARCCYPIFDPCFDIFSEKSKNREKH
jgi:hypothetical protein